MTLLLIVVKVLIVAAAVTGVVAYCGVLQRARRRRDPASQFVRLTAARRATLDETSTTPDIGGDRTTRGNGRADPPSTQRTTTGGSR
jgi:hypothetical protein